MARLSTKLPRRSLKAAAALLLSSGCYHSTDLVFDRAADAAESPEGDPVPSEEPSSDEPMPSDNGPQVDTWPELKPDQFGKPVQLSGAYQLAEGVVWDPCTDHVLFTDVEASVVHAIDRKDSITTVRKDTNYANGLAIDRQGRLLMAQMGGGKGGRIVRVERDGSETVLADKTASGATLNTSDDLIVRSDGTVYFSDPLVSHGPFFTLNFSATPLYRIAAKGGAPVQEGTEQLPNGVDLSPDEKTLYVNAYLSGTVLAFDVAESGALSHRRTVISGLSIPDSMCVDAAGNLYVGVRQGIAVVRPDGKLVTTIAMQTTKGVTNCNFGGEGGKTLYITAFDSLWKLTGMPVPGLEWKNRQGTDCKAK